MTTEYTAQELNKFNEEEKDKEIFFKDKDDLIKYNDKIFNWLIGQRLENYGYDYNDFQKLVNRKTHLIKELKKHYKILHKDYFYGIFNRLYTYNANINYCVGQSFNEELITLLECFTNNVNENKLK